MNGQIGEPFKENKFFYYTRPAIWDALIYTNKDDILYANSPMPKSFNDVNFSDRKNTGLPDSLFSELKHKVLGSFDKERKAELYHIGQWFGYKIFIDSNGILKEVEYTVPNKVFRNRQEHRSILDEKDLLNIDEAIKGMQLILPLAYKEVGYIGLNFAVSFKRIAFAN